jgi:hypothetical protein
VLDSPSPDRDRYVGTLPTAIALAATFAADANATVPSRDA